MDFLHVFDESLQSLGVLNIEDLPGFILFVLANKTLPSVTRKLFERDINADFPVIEDLVSFVKCRIKILENVGLSSAKSVSKLKSNARLSEKLVMVCTKFKAKAKCSICKDNHSITTCTKFLKMSPPKRFSTVTSS